MPFEMTPNPIPPHLSPPWKIDPDAPATIATDRELAPPLFVARAGWPLPQERLT